MMLPRFGSVLFLSVVLFNFTRSAEESATAKLGAIFDEDHEDEEHAFKYAVENLNFPLNFASRTKSVSYEDSFEALNTGCSLLQEEVLSIFGPRSPDNINAVHSLCDHKDIPHIITQWDFRPLQYKSIINLHPKLEDMVQAYLDIIMGLHWKSFTVFYEDVESIRRVGNLIRAGMENGMSVTVRKLDDKGDGIYRTNLKKVASWGQKNFVIDCRLDILPDVLLQAQQVGIMTGQYKYFVTNLDMHLLDLEQFQYSGAKISGIRLINPESELVSKTILGLSKRENTEKEENGREKEGNEGEEDENVGGEEEESGEENEAEKGEEKEREEEETASFSLQYKTALLMDGVSMVAQAIQDVMPELLPKILQKVRCDTEDDFFFGSSIVNLVKTSEYRGLTGLIKFNNEGHRSYFELEVIELTDEGIHRQGIWNSTLGLYLEPERHGGLHNWSFVVITCLTKPYGMLKETTANLVGNDRFEGFGIDLIKELAAMEGFNYTFIIREDKANGKKDASGNWSGMIGDLIRFNADLAITDLTITAEREEAVDFTPPFMNLGISILFRKPKKAPPSFFSFADPFALDTWGMLALAYAVVTIALFIIGRICPDEWTNPYPCIEEPEFLVNQFSLANSAWFTIGSLMQQGTEIAPIGVATRMVAGMWWFFVLIMVSSYTANLAASLATENPIELFTDIHSLVANAKEHKISYGAKSGGATAGFFNNSETEIFRKVGKHMTDFPQDMVKENDDGVKRAEQSDYAFFMESTSIEYETQRRCGLQQYGNLLDDKGYGIAMRKNSPYRKTLSTAMLKLQAAGTLAALKRKWWQEQRGGGSCSGDDPEPAAEPLKPPNVEGVFYVSLVGIACSILFVILEMLLHTLATSMKTKVTFKEVLKYEIKAYLDFNSNVKPVMNREKSESVEKSKSKSASEEQQSNHKSESKSGRGTSKDAKSSSGNDGKNRQPEPYGFISAVSKERLTDSS